MYIGSAFGSQILTHVLVVIAVISEVYMYNICIRIYYVLHTLDIYICAYNHSYGEYVST